MEKTKIETIDLFCHWEGRSLYVGKIKVVSYWSNAMRSRNDPKEYRVGSEFIKLKESDYETEQECKEVCLKVAIAFCNKLKTE